MLRSMYSAIGGLKNFQTKLDVIANNISNVNTYGYKKSRVTFEDLVSQQIAGASAPQFNRGGTNPKQVGLGSTIGSIDTIHTQGSLQTTGRALDIAISGDGYFQVTDGANSFYTRAGNFYLDAAGNLVNADGLRLQGYMIDSATGELVSAATDIQMTSDVINQPMTDALNVVGNLNMSDFLDNNGVFNSGNGKTLPFSVFDANGTQYAAEITIGKTGTVTNGQVTALSFAISSPEATGVSENTGTITFNADGSFESFTLNDANGNGVSELTMDYGGQPVEIPKTAFDFDGLSVLDQPNTADVVGDVAKITSFSIGASGEVSAVLSNGDVQTVAKILLYTFNNPGGLAKSGSNLYMNTSNSGEPTLATPGVNGGTFVPGTLEMSNVDLAKEFTEMIVAQRGFQANARVISTSDKILQELVNLKR